MQTLSPVKNSKDTSLYFSKDNYYSKKEGIEHSEWMGEGAEILKINSKPVDPEQFNSLLNGAVGNAQLGRKTKKGIEHRPGWDLTFSAPKSASIMIEIYNDSNVSEAHDIAVKEAVKFVEKNLIYTRLKNGKSIDKVQTKNAVIATFRHDVSRELDPNTHTHALFMNATHTPVGWRSVDPDKLFNNVKQGGLAYRTAFKRELESRGYKLRFNQKNPSLFELADVPQSLIDEFSTRSKQIKDYFKNRELNYDTKLAKQVALLTRKSKKKIERNELKKIWKDRIESMTGDNKLSRLLNYDASELADKAASYLNVEKTKQQVINSKLKNTNGESKTNKQEAAIRRLVRKSVRHLTEREMAATELQICETALKFNKNNLKFNDIYTEIERLKNTGYLLEAPRHKSIKANLYTTKKAIGLEEELKSYVEKSRGYGKALIEEKTAKKYLTKKRVKGRLLNDQQLNAVLKASSSKDRLFAIQGDAGVGKTTTLSAYKDLLIKKGYDVIGMAPSYQAVSELTDSLRIEGMTVDMYIANPASEKLVKRFKRQVWFIDEGSMLSTDKMNELMSLAEQRDARVLLVGDHKQLEAVGAGRAFYQMQDAGVDMAVIDKRLRQKTDHMKLLTEHVVNEEFGDALNILSERNNIVVSREERAEDDSIKRLAEDWLSRDAKRREETLIVAPTNSQRKSINNVIRDSLKKEGSVSSLEYGVNVFNDRYLTDQEKWAVSTYKNSDVIRFSRDYKNTSRKVNDHINKHEYFDVVGRNTEKNTLALKSRYDQRIIYIDPRKRGGNIKGGMQVFEESKLDFAKGDKIKWTDNSNKNGLKRNTQAVVQRVASDYIRILTEKGKSLKLDLHDVKNRHFTHDYAKTAYGVQGKTEKEVLALMQSWRVNTTTQRSFMVAVTRAEENVTLFTDSISKLSDTLTSKTGDNTVAITSGDLVIENKKAPKLKI